MHAPDAAHLVELYLALALSIANRWAKAYPGLRDDFRSDAALALWQAATKFTPRDPADPTHGFPPWAREYIRWALVRRLKLSRRRVPVADLGDEMGIEDVAMAAPGVDPDAPLDAAVLLTRLNPERRDVVSRFAAGETFPEIAAARGVTGSAVRSMFDRAIRELGGG